MEGEGQTLPTEVVAEFGHLQRLVETVTTANQQLQTQAQEVDRQLASLLFAKRGLQEQVSDRLAKITALETKLAATIDEKKVLLDEKLDLSDQVMSYQKQLVELGKTRDILTETNSSLTDQVSSKQHALDTAVAEARAKEQQLQDQLTVRTREISNLETSLETTRAEKTELLAKKLELMDEVTALQKSLATAGAEKEALIAKSKDASDQVDIAARARDAASAEVVQLKLDLEQAQAETRNLQQERITLKGEVATITRSRDDALREVAAVQRSLEELQEHMKRLKDQNETLSEKASEAVQIRDAAVSKVTTLERRAEASELERQTAVNRFRALHDQVQRGEIVGAEAEQEQVALAVQPEQTRPRDALDFYDLILKIGKFTDAYNSGGWKIRYRANFKVDDALKGVRVIPLGRFNTGKTWLLSCLCGSDLPSGTDIHTEGISIKLAAKDSFDVVLLDTVGADSPIGSSALPHMGEAGSAGLTKEQVAAILSELRLQEDFYRQLSFKLAQVVLLVVGQMSNKDQTDLVNLARDIQKGKRRKDIVVVHNLREWSRKQLEERDADGRNYMERNRDLFSLDDTSIDETLPLGEKKRVDRHNGLLESGGASQPVQVTHYYLTNGQLPCSLNDFAIQNMRTVITNTTQNSKPLLQELAEAASTIQTRFVRFTAPGAEPPLLRFNAPPEHQATSLDHREGRFIARPKKDGEPYGEAVTKPRSLGTYFAGGLEEVVYNVTAFPCTVESKAGHAHDEEEDEDETSGQREAYLVQVELPGLTADSLNTIIKELSIRRGQAVRSEAPELGMARVTMVDFVATLSNVPEHFYQAAAASKNKYVIPPPSAHEVTEQGTRAEFTHGERTVKVTIWTNIEDRDREFAPLVTYIDGILSITLIRERQ